ncbi:MAG: hypothetical protein ACBR20_16545 [Microcoleus sp.]
MSVAQLFVFQRAIALIVRKCDRSSPIPINMGLNHLHLQHSTLSAINQKISDFEYNSRLNSRSHSSIFHRI